MMNLASGTDLIVFSSDKFGFEGLRTSEVMQEFAFLKRVYFIEAPVIGVVKEPTYFFTDGENEVTIVYPYLPGNTSVFEQKKALLGLMKELIVDEHISHYTLWTDTPNAMHLIRNMSPDTIVYDCIKNYSWTNPELENELLQYADEVLTSAVSNELLIFPRVAAESKPHFQPWAV